jgi:alpha-L-fucosidase
MSTATQASPAAQRGAQRHSRERLAKWLDQKLGYFIHYGMSTFDQVEWSLGETPGNVYAPTALDVDQWIRVIAEAGGKYAVLTTKHTAGHCLWPSKLTDYHIGSSGSDKRDVVALFVEACKKYGVAPGFYYCSWDNHHLMGSISPNKGLNHPWRQDKPHDHIQWELMHTTREYEDFMLAQIQELHRTYGQIGEWWIDIPDMLSHAFRRVLYGKLAEWQPDSVIIMNNGVSDGSVLKPGMIPTDIITIEGCHPPSMQDNYQGQGHNPWRTVMGQQHYIPAEVVDTVNKRWFWTKDDQPRSDQELLGLYLIAVSRGANLMLDVCPDITGQIPADQVGAVKRLKANIDRLGF